MTVNAFLFSWDCTGVEAIVPITQYEDWDTANAFNVLEGKAKTANPLNSTINSILLRARANPQRFYEVYAVDCDDSITHSMWRTMWDTNPQQCADIIRERGVKLYGEPMPVNTVRIR